MAGLVKVVCKRCGGDGLYGRETMFGSGCLECGAHGYLMLSEADARKYEATKAYIARRKAEGEAQLEALETTRQAQALNSLEQTYTMRGTTYTFEMPTDFESVKRLEWLRGNSRKYCATAEYYLDLLQQAEDATSRQLSKKLNQLRLS